MNVVLLENDKGCRWLDNNIENNVNKKGKNIVIVEKWLSSGCVYHDKIKKNIKKLGVRTVRSINEVDKKNDIVLNLGYNMPYKDLEDAKRKKIIVKDSSCPYIKKLINIFINADNNYQYIFLCDETNVIIKNLKEIFPKDIIIVQTDNYKARIEAHSNNKPKCIVPYITYMQEYVEEIKVYIDKKYYHKENRNIATECMWVSSPFSPISELNHLDASKLKNIKTAVVLIADKNYIKNIESLTRSLKKKGLNLIFITNLSEFIKYEYNHRKDTILLVRTPESEQVSILVMEYLRNGLIGIGVKIAYGKMISRFKKKNNKLSKHRHLELIKKME